MLREGRVTNVDPEVRAELTLIESRLQKSVSDSISAGFRDMKGTISELFDKDIGHIREWQETFKKYHDEHYMAERKIREEMGGMRISISHEIDDKLEPIRGRLENLEGRQIKDEVVSETKDKIEDRADRKTELTWLKIVGIISIGGAVGALIRHFIG